MDKVVYKLLKFEKQGDEAYVNAIPGPKLSGSTLKGYGPDAGLWKAINSLAGKYNLAPQTTNNIHRAFLLSRS